MKSLLISLPGGGEWMIIMIIMLSFLIVFVPFIFYIITLSNTMKEVSEENRKMPPSNMWLMLIPIFGSFYMFFVVDKLSDSLAREFRKKDLAVNEARPGYNVGIATCVLFLLSGVPVIGAFAALAGIVCWIVHWVRMSNYKNLLIRNPHIYTEIQGDGRADF